MADRSNLPDDVAVDELKRKARRRLVGAVVLALAAAVLVPLLLEKEPRPLGDEVAVQIPPVDEGRFVSKLPGAKPKDPLPPADARGGSAPPAASPATASPPAAPPTAAAGPAADAAVPATAAPKKSVGDAEQRVLMPPSRPAPAARPAGESAPPAAAKAAPEPATPDPAKAEVPKPAPDKAAAKPAPAKSPGTAAKPEGFVVQLAAYADDKGANALANRLKKSGYAAYVEPVETTRGTLWRVRVGGYVTREAATAARDKLKAEGQSGIVAPAR